MAATKAVVRVVPQNCQTRNCGPGSGVIIHPDGIILTAWHVTVHDYLYLASPEVEDIFVETTDNTRLAPRFRYRARVIASRPDLDVALLRIYWDERAGQAVGIDGIQELPALPLSEEIPTSGQLRVMGYSVAGDESINYPIVEISGFADEGTAWKVTGPTLSEGLSGGPGFLVGEDGLEIAGIVLSRKGTFGEVGRLRIWQAADGQLLQTLEGHTSWVRSVSWSPDGGQVASGSDDGTVRIWQATDGQLLQTFEGHTGSVNSVSWSPDGGQVVSGSWDGTVRIWDVR